MLVGPSRSRVDSAQVPEGARLHATNNRELILTKAPSSRFVSHQSPHDFMMQKNRFCQRRATRGQFPSISIQLICMAVKRQSSFDDSSHDRKSILRCDGDLRQRQAPTCLFIVRPLREVRFLTTAPKSPTNDVTPHSTSQRYFVTSLTNQLHMQREI
jgi:hypothetical protein